MSEPGSLSGWQHARRVLGIRLDAIGDVLMTEPALRALAQSLPGRQLTLLTSSSGQEAARLIPYLEEVVVYDAPWMKATSARSSSADDLAMVECLRARRFDAAVIFTVYTQSALPGAWLCCLADIPLRAAHCRENPYRLLTDWVRETEPDIRIRHEVRRQLDLVASVGCTSTDVGERGCSLRRPSVVRADSASPAVDRHTLGSHGSVPSLSP
jgi:ADP-heptose:LPS heptosyltransferase